MDRYKYLQKYRKYPAEQLKLAEMVTLTDKQLRLDIETDKQLGYLKLGNEVIPVMIIPLIWDSDKQMYTIGKNPPTDITHIGGVSQTGFDLYTQLNTMLEHMGLAPYPITSTTARFTGTWNKGVHIDSPSGYYWISDDTSTPGSLEVKFYGTKVVIFFIYGSNMGIANIYVDNVLIESIDLYDSVAHRTPYFIYDLSDSEHTLKIEVSGNKNTNSTDYSIQIEGLYFEAGKNPVQLVDSYNRNKLANIHTYTSNLWNKGLVSPLWNIETTTPLTANAVYTGSWLDLGSSGYSYILALVYSDQSGTLYIEQSHDGSTVIRQDSLSYTGGDTSGNLMKVQVMARYVRLRYVNGATDQTTFVLTRRFSMS